jgi:hypothetical protein
MTNRWVTDRVTDTNSPFHLRRDVLDELQDDIDTAGGGGGGGTAIVPEPFEVRTGLQTGSRQIRIATQRLLNDGTVPESKSWNIVSGNAQSTFINVTLKPSSGSAPTARGDAITVASGTTSVTPTQQVDTHNGDVQIATVCVFPDTAPAPTPSSGTWSLLWDVTWFGGFRTYAYIRQTGGFDPVGTFSSAGATAMLGAVLSIGGVLWPSWPVDQINSVAGSAPPELPSGGLPATSLDNELYVILGSFNAASDVNDPDGTFYPTRPTPGTGGGGGTGGSLTGVFDVTADPYFADPTGVSSARSAINAAIVDAAVDGGIVYLPPGTYKDGFILLPKETTKHVTIQGAGIGATVLQNTPSYNQGFVTVSDDTETTRLITIQDLTVDGGSQYVPARGVVWDTSNPTNLHDIEIKRVRSVNVGNGCRNINMTLAYDWAGPDFQDFCTVERLHIEDVEMNGGDYGVLIQGFVYGGADYAYRATLSTDWGSPGTANCWFDEIYIRRCRHDTLQTFYGRGDSCNFMIGAQAHVGKVRVSDCHGLHSFDDNFEFNTIKDLVVERCIAEEGGFEGFYHTPIGGWLDPTIDKHTYIDCECRWVSSNDQGYFWRGFKSASQGSPTAHQKFIRCKYIDNSPVPSSSSQYPWELDGEFLELIDCSVSWAADHLYTTEGGGDALTGIAAGCWTGKCHVTIRGFTYIFAPKLGMTAPAVSRGLASHVIDVVTGDVDLVVEDIKVVWDPQLITGTSPRIDCQVVGSNTWGVDPAAGAVAYGSVSDLGLFIWDSGTWASGAITVTSGAVAPVSSPTSEYRLMTTNGFTDGWMQHKFTPSTVAGHKGGVIIKRRNATNYVEAWVDGTAQQLKLDKVVNGTRTALATPVALVTNISSSTAYWIRIQAIGNAIRADYYTSVPADTIPAVGNTTISYTVAATSAEIHRVGERAFGNYGWSWIPVTTAARADDYRSRALYVRDFQLRGAELYSRNGDWTTAGALAMFLTTGGDDTNTRFRRILLENLDFTPWNGAGGTDFTNITAAMTASMRQLRVKRRASQVPVAAAVTPGASPYTWTNQLGYDAYLNVQGPASSTVEISRDGTNFTTFAVADVSAMANALVAPGEMVRITWASSTPTLKSIPVM